MSNSQVDFSTLDTDFIDLSEIPKEERNQKWHEIRRTIIGASDIAGVLGISPWASPWSVWADKLGIMPNQTESTVMRSGKYLERAIVPWFEDETGMSIVAEQFVAISRANKRIGATLDGLVAENGNVSSVFEMKTGSADDWVDEIPIYYQTQAQWQMFVTGLERAQFALFEDRRKPLAMFELERNQKDIDFMVEEAEKFLQLIDDQTPPAADGAESTLEAMRSYWDTPVEAKTVDITHLKNVVEDLRSAKASIKEAEEKERLAKAVLIEAIADAEIAEIDGKKAFTFKRSETTRMMSKDEVKALYPRASMKLMKTTSSRTLRDCASKKGK